MKSDSPLKILMISPEFPPHSLGGGGVLVKLLSKELLKAGQQIRILSGQYQVENSFVHPSTSLLDYLSIIWFPLFKAPKCGFQLNTITPPNFYSIAEAMKILLFTNYDVVNIHGYGHFFNDFIAVLVSLRKKPFVLTIHGFPKQPQRQGGLLKSLFQAYNIVVGRQLIKAAARVTVVSTSLARECQYYADPEKIVVIHNAVTITNNGKHFEELEKTKRKYGLEDIRIILCIGRFSVAKGFQFVLDALPLVLKKIPNVKVVLVGKDDGYGYLDTLKRRCRHYNIEPHVFFLTNVNDEEKEALLWCADVVVIPSIEEVFGIVALEAMNAGRKIIANKIGGLAEVLSKDEFSSLLNVEDSAELADELIACIEDTEASINAIKQRAARIRAFNPQEMANKYLEVYRDAAGRSRSQDR
jgi:glycosyltransferase involved in cell wall biosynthesis